MHVVIPYMHGVEKKTLQHIMQILVSYTSLCMLLLETCDCDMMFITTCNSKSQYTIDIVYLVSRFVPIH